MITDTQVDMKLANLFYDDGKELAKRLKISKPSKNPNELRENLIEYQTQHKVYKILFGISAELLLKALYIRIGYRIYELKKPHCLSEWRCEIDRTKTVRFSELIEEKNLKCIFSGNDAISLKEFIEGLKVIQKWRNEESHSSNDTTIIDGNENSKALLSFTILYANAIDIFEYSEKPPICDLRKA